MSGLILKRCKKSSNNPVNMLDEDEEWPKWVKNVVKAAVGVAATVAAVGITVATGGAVMPVLVGVAVSTASSAVLGYLTGGKQGMIDGAADGLLWSGVGALATSAIVAAPKIAQSMKAAKNDPIKAALRKLDSSGVRPGQTEIRRSRVMDIVKDFDSSKATSSVFKKGNVSYLVEGHHTTVASTILGKGTSSGMRVPTLQDHQHLIFIGLEGGISLEEK